MKHRVRLKHTFCYMRTSEMAMWSQKKII